MSEIKEFDSFYIWAILYKKKLMIIIFTLLITLGAVIVSFILPEKFKSTVNVVPPKSTEDGLGGALSSVSSTLKNFGITKLGGAGGAESYTFIVILNSRNVIDSVIHKFELYDVYDLSKDEMDMVRKIFLSNLDVAYESEGNYYISIWDEDPQRAADIANYYVQIANKVAINLSQTEAKHNLEIMQTRLLTTDSTLNVISKELQKFSSENMIISPLEQAAAVSESYAELKAQKIQYEVMYEVYKSYFGENDDQTLMQKQMIEQLEINLDEIENKPGFAGDFSLRDASKVGIEYLRLFAEYETYTQVKAFLLPMVEKAKLDVKKASKSVYILDEAIPAEKKDLPKRSLIVVGAFIGSFVLILIFILLQSTFNSFRKRMKDLES